MIHATKSGIVLRERALQMWWRSVRSIGLERLVAVEVGEIRLVATYPPLWEWMMKRYEKA